MSDESGTCGDGTYQSYSAEYCESCGHLVDASDEIKAAVEEPVHRVDILEAIGDVEDVGETVAVEEDTCDCTGTIVTRWYAYPVWNIPETGFEPDPDHVVGRDPDEDALVNTGEDWKEASEIAGLEVTDGDQ